MSVKIGRKELFSFAERHSSKRHLKEYSDLADGKVLCELFSLVFPQHKIRPASEDTLSPSQRARINWEAIFRGFARLYIPLPLLNPIALRDNDTSIGFSTLVLFYFLYNLSKKSDFSAEFSMDVTDDLTSFLQSVDSIATLLLGGAMDFSDIPESLVDTIKALPGFRATPKEVHKREEAALQAYRNLMNITVKRRSTSRNAVMALTSPVPAEECAPSSVGGTSTTREEESSSLSEKSDSEHLTNSNRSEGQTDYEEVCQRNQQLLLEVESLRKALGEANRRPNHEEEVTLLRRKYEDEVLHSKLLSEKINEVVRENEALRLNRHHAPATRRCDDEAINALLADVVDPETQQVIDVHDTINRLHCLLLEHLGKQSILKKQGQAWLWSTLTAFDILETRLMAAVEMIDALRDGTKKVVAPVEHTAPSNSQSPPWQDLLQSQLEKARYVRECHDSQLDELHQTEHQLRQSLMATHTTLEAVSQKAKRREEKWRELCAALHAAEQTVFALLECQEESGAEALLQQRDRYYETVDRLTVDLLQDAEVNLSTSSQPPHSGGELCLSLKARLDNAVRERNEYLETIESLQETIRQLSHASAAPEVSVKRILQQQKKYEESEVTDYESASKRYDHKNNNTSSGELHTVSPPRKNLSALLAEATSPYDSLLY